MKMSRLWGRDPSVWTVTVPETNIAPENGWWEYSFPFGMAYFQGRAVSFRGFLWMRKASSGRKVRPTPIHKR